MGAVARILTGNDTRRRLLFAEVCSPVAWGISVAWMYCKSNALTRHHARDEASSTRHFRRGIILGARRKALDFPYKALDLEVNFGDCRRRRLKIITVVETRE